MINNNGYNIINIAAVFDIVYRVRLKWDITTYSIDMCISSIVYRISFQKNIDFRWRTHNNIMNQQTKRNRYISFCILLIEYSVHVSVLFLPTQSSINSSSKIMSIKKNCFFFFWFHSHSKVLCILHRIDE